MAVAELTTTHTTTQFTNSSFSYVSSSARLSDHRRLSFRHLSRAPATAIRCSVTSDQVQAAVGVDMKPKGDCFGVFCLTYDLKAEEETKSWKKMINVAVSGAAGMIANHLLFKEMLEALSRNSIRWT